MSTPTRRTLEYCRREGWMADICEKWIPAQAPKQAETPEHFQRFHRSFGRRKDLFGFIDVICIRPGAIVAIQATSGSNGIHRVKKIQQECSDAAAAWLDAGGEIEVWAWRKYAQRENGRLWRPRITTFSLDDAEHGY